MDKKTFLQFLLISVAIIVGWQLVMLLVFGKPRPAGRPAEPAEARPAEQIEQPQEPPTEPAEAVPVVGADIAVERGLILENDLLQTSWTNMGAALERLTLKHYRAPYKDEAEDERPLLTLVRDFQEGRYSDVVEAVTFLAPPGEQAWREEVPTDTVLYERKQSAEGRLVFEGLLDRDRGLAVRKTISMEPGAHHYDATLEFTNLGEQPLRFYYKLRGPAGLEREELRSRYLGSVVGVRQGNSCDVTLVRAPSLRGGNRINESANIVWAGVANQYFVAFVQPDRPDWIKTVESRLITDTQIAEGVGRWSEKNLSKRDFANRAELARSNATAVIQSTELNLLPGQTVARSYRFVGAPVLAEALRPYGPGITKALRAGSTPFITQLLSLGTIGWVSPLLLGILEMFHSVFRNYGVAILLMTLLVRIVLHPLTRMSQRSMRKMQLLQPRLAEIQKKFKDDKQKQVQEQMALYKRYGVHPLSGCLPMLLQMPVFIALFVTLRTSVQLRQATFIPAWINDLSQPDTVWHMPVHLPFLGNEFNILPFLMVAAWMLNQQFMPKPADPRAQQQQKFMKWMPIMFAVMLYHFASGLLLYWTTSSALGILEQWLIRRQMAGMKLEPVQRDKRPQRAATLAAGGRKPGLLSRMMQRVEEQQKRSGQARSSKPRKRG